MFGIDIGDPAKSAGVRTSDSKLSLTFVTRSVAGVDVERMVKLDSFSSSLWTSFPGSALLCKGNFTSCFTGVKSLDLSSDSADVLVSCNVAFVVLLLFFTGLQALATFSVVAQVSKAALAVDLSAGVSASESTEPCGVPMVKQALFGVEVFVFDVKGA